MQTVLQVGIPVVLVGMMFVVGLDLQARDFLVVRRQFRLIWIATLAQLVLVPGVVLLLARFAGLTDELEIGLLVLAACPGGAISNTYTYLARGNLALSIVLTAASCSLAFATLPLICFVGGRMLGHDVVVHVPIASLALQLGLFVLTPIVLGATLRRRFPAFVTAHQRLWQRFSLVALVTLLALVVVPEFGRFVQLIPQVAPLLGLWTLLSGAGGWAIGWLGNATPASRVTLAIEFAVRNLGIGALVGLNAFAKNDFAVLAALCFLVQVPLLLAAVYWFRKSIGHARRAWNRVARRSAS